MRKPEPIRLPLSSDEAERLRDLLHMHILADGTYAVLHRRLDDIIQRRRRRDDQLQQP